MYDKIILIVDDETDLLDALQSIFLRAGYKYILTATSGKTALKIWEEKQPDIIVLDVMMPEMDGFEVLKEIRKTSKVPVLMLTARGEADDKFRGFESGADDYLIKPFLPKELLFRVRAILKRVYPEKDSSVYLDAATVNLEKAEVRRGDKIFPLTAKELTLFFKLYQNAGRIVTTGSLCEAICGEFWQGYEKTLSTHLRHLREKLNMIPLSQFLLLQ